MTDPAGLYRPVAVGPLTLPGNLFLAPVAGYTDRAFRQICAGYGANLCYTELASSEAIVRWPGDLAESKTGRLMRRGEGEAFYAVQLFGADPGVMYRAALKLAPFRPDLVDINCGCPVPKVVKSGAGSALMRDPALLGRIVAAVVRASGESLGGVPVTVKIRSGWDAASLSYREAAAAAVDAGAALVCLHPRTRAQGYGGKSDWSLIADLAGRLPVPTAGSGDLLSAEAAERMLRETGCAALMFARGALGNPFIFRETRALLLGESCPVPAPAERAGAAFRHLGLLIPDLGEYTACREMRKQFCAYTKGVPGSARLRDALVRAETREDFHRILETINISKTNNQGI
ncbi:MAG: tRNA dihydrouridine synthase DusB [Spirochaetaceae bacterium]|nr:tRNA dihydrouridine synthase DusB [Spirochaetaceae bacterium]